MLDKRVWIIGTTNNTTRSLDSAGGRFLESNYNDAIINKNHPFFGGWKDTASNKQFLDISVPITTTEDDAMIRAGDKIQDTIVGISSTGGKKEVFLPRRKLPEQGSEPVY